MLSIQSAMNRLFFVSGWLHYIATGTKGGGHTIITSLHYHTGSVHLPGHNLCLGHKLWPGTQIVSGTLGHKLCPVPLGSI